MSFKQRDELRKQRRKELFAELDKLNFSRNSPKYQEVMEFLKEEKRKLENGYWDDVFKKIR